MGFEQCAGGDLHLLQLRRWRGDEDPVRRARQQDGAASRGLRVALVR